MRHSTGCRNVLEKDDRTGVYAAAWLEANYTFGKPVTILDNISKFVEHVLTRQALFSTEPKANCRYL